MAISTQRWSKIPLFCSIGFLIFACFIALFADFIANDKPLWAKHNSEQYFPVFYNIAYDLNIVQEPSLIQDWKIIKLENAIWPPCHFLPENQDIQNMQCVSPFNNQNIIEKHYLGTDAIGRDTLSGIIHGARISLSIGFISVIISAMMGICLGGISGFWGDGRLILTRAQKIGIIVGLFLGGFYGFYIRSYTLSSALTNGMTSLFFTFIVSLLILILCVIISMVLFKPLEKFRFFGKKSDVSVDIYIQKGAEIMESLPTLLLILSIAAISKPGIGLTMIIIGITSAPRVALLTRAEMLRTRTLGYIDAATALGFSNKHIFIKHALPNALPPVLVLLTFNLASAILIEASLSFLGVGVSATSVTWGAILASAKDYPFAWWLYIPSGLALFCTIASLYYLTDYLRERFSPSK